MIAQDETAIRSTLASYNDALNGGETAAVLPLYTDDGVFMPPYSQSAVGKNAVEKAYDAVFSELKFHVKWRPTGRMSAQIRRGQRTIVQQARLPRNRIKNSSSSRRMTMEYGASPATAFRRRILPRASFSRELCRLR